MRRNTWNFNELTPHESASLREGLRAEGWLACFALLIWRTDETGVLRNVIIDGEHRHDEATALGFAEGPMVFLDGLTEEKAREMTAKLTLIRGRSNEARLSDLLRSLPANLLDATALGLSPARLSDLTRLDLPRPRVSAGVREDVALAELRPHPENYKGHPEDQLEHLVASLLDFGPWRDLVLARDGTILAGHALYEAARRAGYLRLSAVRYPLDPASPLARKIVAVDNEVGLFAETDDRRRTDLLRAIREDESVGLLGTGFDVTMLAALAMVTRPASELHGVDEARTWAGAGMPDYQPTPNTGGGFRLMVNFDTEADRDTFLAKNELVVHKRLTGSGGLFTTYWPPRPRDDIASLRFRETGGEPPAGEQAVAGRRRKAATA